MLETSARLLKLLSLLQSPRDWSGTALAEELGVGVRTVRRDVDKLRNLGYPVDAVPGVAGYRLGAGASLPPLLLDDEEAVAVAIGLRAAATGSVEGIEESSVRALTKLEQVLPSRLRHRIKLLQSVAVTPTVGATVAPDVVLAVATASRDHQRLRFDYRSHDGTSTTRTTEPHRLVHTGRRWYLVAWDLDPRFTPREDVPELGETSRGVASGGYRYQARFTLRAPAEVLADRIANTVGTVEPVDTNTCTLTTGANSLDELLLHIGLLGHPFTIEEPPELIDHARGLADRLKAATPA
jgi:biotin operon repressor